ncbi:MAG: UbiD family decarboxylase, partial [Anaerolineae bacterium]|nr:UbiD family decarboxylase [Anaerolineae bacterium]
MTLRDFIAEAQKLGLLIDINKRVDPNLEMAPVIAALDGRPVMFNDVAGSEFRVLSGQCSDRRHFALALGCAIDDLVFRLADAYSSPQTPPLVSRSDASCQQVVMSPPDLQRIPFLTHYPDDAGPYATAAIAIVNDPDSGPNVSFHRCLRLDATHLAARIVERRGTDSALKKTPGDLPVAICIGLPLHVLLAASMAPPPGVDELAIANALAPTSVVRCLTNDLHVPAEAEFVLEGRITHRTVAEGPFVDLTETWDIVRQQPVIEID